VTTSDAQGNGRRMAINEFTWVQQLLLEHAGILLEPGKEYLAESRLAALADNEGYPSISALLDEAHADRDLGDLRRKVIEAMTINETSFFRDLHPFEALRKQILPALIQARASRRALNLWCAAAASGQEAYSLALILREHFPQLAGWKVHILASDISEAMLARARAGAYNQMEINRGLPAALLVKHFRKTDVEWQIRDDVRGMVDFRRINLTGPWPPIPPMDVVLMRNVLLYFDVPTKRSILQRVECAMKRDGVLILGSGETTLNLADSFKPAQYGRAIAYRLSSDSEVTESGVRSDVSTRRLRP